MIIKEINQARLAAKGGWWTYVSRDNRIRIKGYGTWIQRLEHDNSVYSGPMDCTVKEFKDFLLGWFGE